MKVLEGAIPHLKLCRGDEVVCVGDEHVAVEMLHRLELGGQEQAGRAQQLELRRADAENRIIRYF